MKTYQHVIHSELQRGKHYMPYGLLTIQAHVAMKRWLGALLPVDVRILLDGVDVTDDCFVADDKQGYVGLIMRAGGVHWKDAITGGAIHRIMHGQVRYVPMSESGGWLVLHTVEQDQADAAPAA